MKKKKNKDEWIYIDKYNIVDIGMLALSSKFFDKYINQQKSSQHMNVVSKE